MSEVPSDPDLLEYDDLPDSSRVANDPWLLAHAYSQLKDIVQGLARWARRSSKTIESDRQKAEAEREYIRGLAWKVIGAVVAGAIGMMGSVLGAAVYIGVRLERLDQQGRRIDRLESVVFSADIVTTASEDP